MKSWKWPTPINIVNAYDAGLKKKLWDPKKHPNDGKDLMPILTPAYPAFNSSFNVTKSTLGMMKIEFDRAEMMCKKLQNGELPNWDRLFDRTDFFVRYDLYLKVELAGADEKELKDWKGFVESRLRKLVELLEWTKTPLSRPNGILSNIVPYPKDFKSPDKEHTCVYFIGFVVDKQKIKDGELPIDVDHFCEHEVGWYTKRTEEMTINCEVTKWKDLPSVVHEPEGVEKAKALRKLIRPTKRKSKRGETLAVPLLPMDAEEMDGTKPLDSLAMEGTKPFKPQQDQNPETKAETEAALENAVAEPSKTEMDDRPKGGDIAASTPNPNGVEKRSAPAAEASSAPEPAAKRAKVDDAVAYADDDAFLEALK